MEVWKNINGYENIYSVSNHGRVKTLGHNNNKYHPKKEKIRIPSDRNGGYLGVILCKEGVTKMFSSHRLVAEYFIPNPNNLPFVNHKDGNKLNNHYTNLEWCTRSENMKHAYDNNLVNKAVGSRIYNSKLNEEKVLKIRQLYTNGVSQIKIASLYGVTKSNIQYIINHKSWKHIK